MNVSGLTITWAGSRANDYAGPLSVLRECVALLDAQGAFTSSQPRLAEGDVADEIGGIYVPAHPLLKSLHDDALVEHLIEDDLLAVGRLPRPKEAIEPPELFEDTTSGVILE